MKKFIAIFAALILLFVAVIITLKTVGSRLVTTHLISNATPWQAEVSADRRFQIVPYRYPLYNDIPEILGFGQGFVELQLVASGKVLERKQVEDLAAINCFRWTSNTVSICDVVEWSLPQ